MARQQPSLVGRTLVHIDRAFWCIHEHPDVLIPLGLPTFLAMVLTAVAAISVWRTYEFSTAINVVLIAGALPLAALFIFTVLPLPCAVFAHRRAGGEVPTVTTCFGWCAHCGGRLFSVIARLMLIWVLCLLVLGIPLLLVWPRTCMTPLVALFENETRIFRRSRRILREDVAVYVIGAIYLAILVVLGGMVYLPRLILGTNALGAHILDAPWRRIVLEYLWIFEALSFAAILTALAMSLWISLALLYQEICWRREGADLRQKVQALREKLLA